MSNKTAEPEKESTSQTGANSPLGNSRSLLSCPINRRGPGAEGAPRVVADGGKERREEGKKGRATAMRSYCPYHWTMFRHLNDEASAVAGFRLKHSIPSPPDTHRADVCVEQNEGE